MFHSMSLVVSTLTTCLHTDGIPEENNNKISSFEFHFFIFFLNQCFFKHEVAVAVDCWFCTSLEYVRFVGFIMQQHRQQHSPPNFQSAAGPSRVGFFNLHLLLIFNKFSFIFKRQKRENEKYNKKQSVHNEMRSVTILTIQYLIVP